LRGEGSHTLAESSRKATLFALERVKRQEEGSKLQLGCCEEIIKSRYQP